MVLISYSSGSTTFTKAMWQAAPYNSPTVVELGEGWTIIGANAFENTALTSITIPASVTAIGNYAFYQCSDLASVAIPASVITIGNSAFRLCSSLASVTFAAGSVLDTIGSGAFQWTAITSIAIPASVTDISGGSAFSSCSSLESVSFAADSELETIGSGTFEGTALTTIAIPSSVTEIGSYAFYQCSALASVTIPAFVTDIGGNAFYECSVLESVTFAANSVLETIGWGAFQETALTSITIPTSVTSIGQRAFKETALTSVTIAENSQLATIGNEVFQDSGLIRMAILTPSVLTVFGVTEGTGQTVNNKSNVTIYTSLPLPPLPTSTLPAPICFPAGTPVLTDQGEIAIEKIDPEKHTINTNKIEGVTETKGIENYVVMIKKDAFSRTVPCRDTIISANHKIMFNNQMIQAREFVDKNMYPRHIYKIPYSGYTLYNVLLEDKHGLMIVNNLIAETLSPTSLNAWLFRQLKSDISNAERTEVMDAYMQRLFPAPVISSFMVGCK